MKEKIFLELPYDEANDFVKFLEEMGHDYTQHMITDMDDDKYSTHLGIEINITHVGMFCLSSLYGATKFLNTIKKQL